MSTAVSHRVGGPSAVSPRAGALAVVAGPAVLAAVASVISLAGRQLGFDEGATVAIASQHGHALWHAIARDGGNMSGDYLLLHVLVSAFGDGPWVLRLPSVIGAAATAGLVAALGRTLFADRVGAVAGVLCAVSLPVVFWAQSDRAYALMLAFVCAGMLAFVALLRAAAQGRRATWPAVAYVVAMGLAAYCSFVAVLVVLAQLPLVWRRPRAARAFAAALVALAVIGIPLVVLAARRGSGQLFWLSRPTGKVVTQALMSVTGTGLRPSFQRVFSTTPGWIATGLVVLAVAGMLVGGRLPVAAERRPLALVLSWAIVPAGVTFVYSLLAPQPLFVARNLLISVPAVALVVAAALADRRLPRWVAAAGLGAALLVRVAPLVAAYGVSPEPWQSATARVLAAARPGDCVAFYPQDGRNAFRWSAARDHALARAPRSVLPAVPWRATTPYVEVYATLSRTRIAAVRRGCPRLWLVSSHEGQADGPAGSRAHRRRWLALRRGLGRAYRPGPVATLGDASPIRIELLRGR